MNKLIAIGVAASAVLGSTVIAYFYGTRKKGSECSQKIVINGNQEASFMSDFAKCTSEDAKKYILSVQDYEKKLGLCDDPDADNLDVISDYDDQIDWVVKATGLAKELCEKLFTAQTAWFIKNGIISMNNVELVNAYRRVWE